MSNRNRMAGIVGLVWIVLYGVWEISGFGDRLLHLAVGNAIHAVGAVFAGCLLLHAYRKQDQAKYWLFYGLGVSLYGAAKIYWTLELIVTGNEPQRFGPAEVLWSLQLICYVMALFHQNRGKQHPAVPYMLDIMLFLSVSVTMYWQVFISPAIGEYDIPGSMMAFHFFRSSISLVILLGLLLLYTLERTDLRKRTMLILVSGFFMKAAANSAALLLQRGTELPASFWYAIPDFFQLAGTLLIGFSVLSGQEEPVRFTQDTAIKPPDLKRYIPLALGGLLLLLVHTANYPLSPVTFGSLLGVMLLSARLFAGIRHTEAVNRTLRETNLNFRNWADNALVGVFIEQDGKLVYVNRFCEEVFGYRSGGMLGHSMLEHIAFSDIPRFVSEVDKLSEKIPAMRFGVTGIKEDQAVLYLEMHLAATYFQGKEALSGTLIDITERKISEQYLIRSEKLSVVGQLAAGVAHEIRNPLTALKGFTQLLHRNADENRKYYEIMLAELERINYIVGEFMVLSKPHNRQQLQEHNIHRILMTIIPILESQAILHNVLIRVESSAADLPKVKCDENQIKQVLVNLMKNAIEAMPDGGLLTIRYGHDALHRKMTMYIEDQGPGIPPELLERLGEPFLTTKEKGTGLGLMVCYKIIQAHEGMMSISSQPGQGTSVKLELPTR